MRRAVEILAIDHAASLLRWVYDRRDPARDVVATAQQNLADNSGPQRVAASLLGALNLQR